MSELRAEVDQLVGAVDRLRSAIRSRIVGQEEVVDDVLVGFLSGGHVLLEGLPGLGKTQLVHALADGLGLRFSRIQFTPDLMPSDITGTRVVRPGADEFQFEFRPGPLFANLVLADEINRATPKTQSALLEAMQDSTVTVGDTTHQLPRPFGVVATQNPIELEGTFPLPEAQLDRFLLHVRVPRPPVDDVVEILRRTTGSDENTIRPEIDEAAVLRLQQIAREVVCAEPLLRFCARLIACTDPAHELSDADTRRFVRYPASPRAAQAIVRTAKVRALLDRRPSVELEDLERSAGAALRHRVLLGFEAEAEGRTVDDLIPLWLRRASAK